MAEMIVLFITRKGCHFCDLLRPIVATMAKEANYDFWEYDEKDQSLLCSLFAIRNYPATLIFEKFWPKALIQTHNLIEYKQRLKEELSCPRQ